MQREKTLRAIQSFLSQMEADNEADECKLFYRFHELQPRETFEKTIHTYYQGNAKKIAMCGRKSFTSLTEPLYYWFCRPTEAFNPQKDSSFFHQPIIQFITLLERLIDKEEVFLYGVDVIQPFYGSFTEHYVLVEGKRMYVLHFTIV